MLRSILIFLSLIHFLNYEVLAKNICSLQFADMEQLKKIHSLGVNEITVPQETFESFYHQINETLSGNLSTVFRIENKWKTNEESAFDFLKAVVIKKNITSSADTKSVASFSDFVQEVKAGKFKGIKSRDPPSPPGVNDRTFTYYTKTISGADGGKHQFRIRTYVREIDFQKLSSEEAIGYLEDGTIAGIKKNAQGLYSYSTYRSTSNGLEKLSFLPNINESTAIEKLGGRPIPLMYAYPHGKGFKLEVKSRLPEKLESSTFYNMSGETFVQKLDLSVTMEEVETLFGNSKLSFAERIESVRVAITQRSVKKLPEVGEARVNTFFNLMNEAYVREPNFNRLSGATEYQRHAFEIDIPDLVDGSKVGVQVTFDYNQGARYVYDLEKDIYNPLDVTSYQPKLGSNHLEDDYHIEFKAPKALVDKAVAENPVVSKDFYGLMKLFNDQKPSNVNAGKFNYIMEQN